MKDIKSLHAKLNSIKIFVKPERLESSQKAYLKRFISDKKILIISLITLIVCEVSMLVALPIILKLFVERDYNMFRLHNLIFDLFLFGLIILIYLAISFAIIRVGQELFFALINQIKRHWLIYFFKTDSSKSSKLSDGSLMAKLLYHTQLLRMGLERTLEGIRAAALYIVIVITAFFLSSTSFFWLIIGFPLLCIITAITWFIGRNYIRREQTLNSRFIKSLFHQMNNLSAITSLGLKKPRFHELNNIIEQDTYFRKRREILVKFSDRLIFALLLLFGGILYLIKDFYPILHWNNWMEGALSIAFGGFFTKILIQSAHAGMFFQALQTGLQIAVPNFTVGKNPLGQSLKINFTQNIVFQGSSVKLSKFGNSIKRFRLTLPPKSHTLIISKGPFGKTSLAKEICGLTKISSINVKNNGKFLKSSSWCKENKYRQFISLTNVNREPLSELLLAKPSADIESDDLNKIFTKLKKYPQFEFIFKFRKFTGKRFDTFSASLCELVLIQVAQAVLSQPNIICVDNSVFDLPYDKVSEALKILEQECSQSIIIYFSAKQSRLNRKYDQIFILDKSNFLPFTQQNAKEKEK